MNSWKNQIVIKTLVPFSAAYFILCVYRANDSSISTLTDQWQGIVAIGALSFGLALFQDLFPKSLKEILVFQRLSNRLPGHRAFSRDRSWGSAIDWEEVIDVRQRSDLDARGQSRKFYRIYDKYRDVGSVSNSSYRYLQWRELAFLSLVASFLVFVRYGYEFGFSSFLTLELVAYGIVSTALSILAARRASNDLVEYVLLAEYLDQTDDEQ